MAGIHYISIPTIDNCDLPNEIIDKCYKAYERYGKYKIYDILNEEMNSSRYSYEMRNKFKNINLIKRYLYLYRQAMVQTMSFVYNTEEFELLDPNIYSGEHNCPKCGKELKILPQRGQIEYYPLSHYRDIQEKFDKVVTYKRFPVKDRLSITFSEYVASKTPEEFADFKFMYWTTNPDTEPVDPNSLITDYLDENGDLALYACYASSATISEASSVLVSDKIVKNVRSDYRIYLKDFINCKVEKPTKNGYVFHSWTLDDGTTIPEDLTDEQLEMDITDLLNGDAIDVVDIFAGDENTSDYILDYFDTIGDFKKLFEASEKENYTFKGFTFNQFDKIMGEIEITSKVVEVNQTRRISNIAYELTQDVENIPWEYLDRSKYKFDYWTINNNGDRMTPTQENTSISAGTEITFYAVFKDTYNDDSRILDIQELFKDSWGENKLILFAQYSYNVPEGTYCYDDSVYTCSKSNYIYRLETELVSPADRTSIGTMIDNYLIETFGNNTTYPSKYGESFCGWALDDGGEILSSFNKKYDEGWTHKLYAVFSHSNKHWGIDRFSKYNEDCHCPICGKKNSYIGRYSESIHDYVKDGYLDILRYTTHNGVLGWHKRYVNGDNETTYGVIAEVASLYTLEYMNKCTYIPDKSLCVDTSRYADVSEASYKIYLYNNKRDPNYDPSEVVIDDDEPDLLEHKWIYLPKDGSVSVTPVDTTGNGRLKYILTGFVKVYLKQDGDIIRVSEKNGQPLSISLQALANSFNVDSSVEVVVGKSEGREKYSTHYTVTFNGNSINDDSEYDDFEKDSYVHSFSIPLTYARTTKTYKDQYPNNVTTWKDKDIVGDFVVDGGYPTAESVKNKLYIDPNSVTTDENGNEIVTSYYDRERYVFRPITETGVEKSSITLKNRNSLMSTSVADDESSVIIIDYNGNVVTDVGLYTGLNYAGWHWTREDATKYYSIDDNITHYADNTNSYPMTLRELLDESMEDSVTVNGTRYKFTCYSLDGYTPITDDQLDNTYVMGKSKIQIHKIYTATINVLGIGIVESDIFDNGIENYINTGFKRVLFIEGYNSTGSLIRYCDNETCYSKVRDIYQRKWSFHNQNATVKNTATGMSVSNFSLDDYNYPATVYKTNSKLWRYPQENQNKSVMLHRGGSGDIDFYRFDFEYKYATDEYDPKKNAHPYISSDNYKSYVLKDLLKRIKGTDIVPFTDRPLKVYQDKYKEKIYQRFNEIYGLMLEFTPYHLLNPDEITVINDILQDLPYEFKLDIISFLVTWDNYVKYSVSEWLDEKYDEYIDRIKKNFNVLFESNKMIVGNTTYYKKALFDERILTPLYNSFRNVLINESSCYSSYPIVVPVTTDHFGEGITDTASMDSIFEYINENYDPYRLTDLSRSKYVFIRWSTSESGEEPTGEELNEFVPIGTPDNPTNVTVYAYFKEIYVDIVAERNIDESWFESKDTFLNKYYTDQELIDESEALFTSVARRTVPGIDKKWWSRTYNNSKTDEYILDDFIESFTDVEFVNQFNDLINSISEEVEFNTGVSENMSLDAVIATLENNEENADTDTMKFSYWSLDGYTPIPDSVRLDSRRVYNSYTIVKLYKVYRLKNPVDTSTFSKDWFNGKEITFEYIKDSLASYHEKLSLPITFIAYMFGLLIWPKRIAIMTDSNGEVGSYLLSSDIMIPSDDDSKISMHRTAVANGNNTLNIKFGIVSNKFPAVIDKYKGTVIYEQYYIIAEEVGTSFKVYSFMKNAWIDDFLTGTDAYDYCLLLKNTSNPALVYSASKLINIIPYSTETDISNLCMVYDTCIVFFNCYTNEWKNTLSVKPLFDSENSFIKHCTYNSERNVLYILSSKNEIATIDLNDESVCSSKNELRLLNDEYIYYIPGIENRSNIVSDSSTELSSATVVTHNSETGETTSSIDETAVAIVKIANIDTYNLSEDERPWYLNSIYSETPILPREISDKYYNELSIENKEKYILNEKLTLRYGFENLGELHPEQEIEYNGNSYIYKRLSFYNNGIAITENQLNKRLLNSTNVFAVYYKKDVEIDEKYGYHILVKTSKTRSDVFKDDLEYQQAHQGAFDASINGYVDDSTVPTLIDKIYCIKGFDIDGKYDPVLAVVTGTRVKILRFVNGNFKVLSAIDYNDNVPVMSVISSDSERKTYIVYKNQRITILTTHLYLPASYKSASTTGEEVTIVGTTNNIENLFINYYTNKDKLHCVKISTNMFADNSFYGRQLDVPKYIGRTKSGGKLTTYLDVKIDQSDFKFYTSRFFKYLTFDGENTDLSRIN